jgi:hypothetical protein
MSLRPKATWGGPLSDPKKTFVADNRTSRLHINRSLQVAVWTMRLGGKRRAAALVLAVPWTYPSSRGGSFSEASWILFGTRRRPSFLDSDPIRLTASAPLFTLSSVGMARRFSSFTAPHNRTLCGAKLPLFSPSASPLSPRICEDMDSPQSRLEGSIIRPIQSVRWRRIRSSSCASWGSISIIWLDMIAGRGSHAG